MSESGFSLFILAIPILIASVYNLFVVSNRGEKRVKLLNYPLLVVSLIVVIWGITSIVLATIDGNDINLNKPSNVLFIVAILVLILGTYDVVRKMKAKLHYSNFLLYLCLIYAFLVFVWGIAGIIIT